MQDKQAELIKQKGLSSEGPFCVFTPITALCFYIVHILDFNRFCAIQIHQSITTLIAICPIIDSAKCTAKLKLPVALFLAPRFMVTKGMRC